MHMQINKVFLNNKELSEEEAKNTCKKYIRDQMTMEGFIGGIGITTPKGILIAEVELII